LERSFSSAPQTLITRASGVRCAFDPAPAASGLNPHPWSGKGHETAGGPSRPPALLVGPKVCPEVACTPACVMA